MSSLVEWQNLIYLMPDRQLSEVEVALETLLLWNDFQRAYDKYGLEVIRDMVRMERERRGRQIGSIVLTMDMTGEQR